MIRLFVRLRGTFISSCDAESFNRSSGVDRTSRGECDESIFYDTHGHFVNYGDKKFVE